MQKNLAKGNEMSWFLVFLMPSAAVLTVVLINSSRGNENGNVAGYCGIAIIAFVVAVALKIAL